MQSLETLSVPGTTADMKTPLKQEERNGSSIAQETQRVTTRAATSAPPRFGSATPTVWIRLPHGLGSPPPRFGFATPTVWVHFAPDLRA